MRKILVMTAMLVAAGCDKSAGKAGGAAAATPTTEEQKALYALGLSMGRQVAVFELTPEELAYVEAGLEAQVKGTTPVVEMQEWGPKIGEVARKRMEARAAKEKERAKEVLEKAAQEPGAVKQESGLVYRELTPGTGASPTLADMVKVNYRGTLADGKEFDSSYKRNEPATFPLGGVIRCWTEGVQKMKVGGKSKLVCPSELAYGDRGTPNIPGGAALTFEVELLEIVKQEPPPAPPMPTGAAGGATPPPPPGQSANK